MKTLIYQNTRDGNITLINTIEEIPLIDNLKELYVDCDMDAYLALGDFPKISTNSIVDTNSNIVRLQVDRLYPAVTLDASNIVLMQAFVNQEAFQLTLETGFAHYFSRSRNKLWKKGEESGHLQKIISIEFNREREYIIYKVIQTSVACHTGKYSCFYRKKTESNELIEINEWKKYLMDK